MKRNKMELGAIILIVAATILAMIMVFYMISQYRTTKSGTTKIVESMATYADEVAMSEITSLDGETVSGADVVNFYKKHMDGYSGSDTAPFDIVINNGTDTHTYNTSDYTAKLRDATDASHYVKATNSYVCKVTKNKNDVLLQVSFTIK